LLYSGRDVSVGYFSVACVETIAGCLKLIYLIKYMKVKFAQLLLLDWEAGAILSLGCQVMSGFATVCEELKEAR